MYVFYFAYLIIIIDVAPLVARKSKTDAYTSARKLVNLIYFIFTQFSTAWLGAAPTGNRKRAVSDVDHTSQPSKKVKKGMKLFFFANNS